MAEQARFSAELLAGMMPQEIDAAFRQADASIFPLTEADLLTDCSCPDRANPCKHIAAAHYVLGEALDRDPFLLFELRGRTKEQVLAAIRIARAGGASTGRTPSPLPEKGAGRGTPARTRKASRPGKATPARKPPRSRKASTAKKATPVRKEPKAGKASSGKKRASAKKTLRAPGAASLDALPRQVQPLVRRRGL